jgi:hypothetical protein
MLAGIVNMAKTIISKRTPIRELITKYQKMKGDKAALISELLISTHEFLVQTTLDMNLQNPYRKSVITPEALLTKTAKSLRSVVDAPVRDEDMTAVLLYCKNAIEEKIKELYEKNNKIAQLYDGHELKDVMRRNSTT